MKCPSLRRLAAIPTLICWASLASASLAADSTLAITIESAASIRGAIYIPAEAYNAPQLWKNFNLAETRRDFGYAREVHLNALRVWASYEYWQMAPERFKISLDQMLAAAHANGLRILLSLFEEDGVAPTPKNMWDTNPATAFDIQSPGSKITHDPLLWEQPRAFVSWFMEHYRNDDRLLAIEVMDEPEVGKGVVPFAKSMFTTAKTMQGTVPLTVGNTSVQTAREFLPLGLDVIEYHDNFPPTPGRFESAITNALAFSRQHHVPVWLTEWQRLRPGGNGWGRAKISASETMPDYASLAPIVHKYPIGNFFWSLMIKRAYLPPQRAQGTVNGLFWPAGSVWSLADARAIAQAPSLKLTETKTLPPGYWDYLGQKR